MTDPTTPVDVDDPDELSDIPTDDPDVIPDGYGLGADESPPDPRDFPIESFVDVGAPALPKAARVATHGAPLYDQHSTNQCVGFAGCTDRTISDFQDNGLTVFDAHELYCATRDRQGRDCNVSEGTDTRTMLNVLLDRGARIQGRTTTRRIKGYARLRGLGDIRTSIVAQRPALIVVRWPFSWFRPTKTGGKWVLPKPGAIAGLHLTTIVEYDDVAEMARIRNTYGTRWGGAGEAWAKYSHLAGLLVEAWATFDRPEHPVPDPTPPPEVHMRLVDHAETGDLATLKPGAKVEDADDKEIGRVPQQGKVFMVYGRTKMRRLAFAWPDGDQKREAYVEPEDVVKVTPKAGAEALKGLLAPVATEARATVAAIDHAIEQAGG